MAIATRSVSRSRSAVLWAVIAGVVGIVANLLGIAFFVTFPGYGGLAPSLSWLGTANDVLVAVMFGALVPVAVHLATWLPARRATTVVTTAAILGLLAVVILQVLLVAGVLDFGVQIRYVTAAPLGVFAWPLLVGVLDRPRGALPRSVTRTGLLIGLSYPVGLLLFGAGWWIGRSAPQAELYALPGMLVGAIGWLALTAWPLLLARRVFTRPPALPLTERPHTAPNRPARPLPPLAHPYPTEHPDE